MTGELYATNHQQAPRHSTDQLRVQVSIERQVVLLRSGVRELLRHDHLRQVPVENANHPQLPLV
jgi:hypothetical protein